MGSEHQAIGVLGSGRCGTSMVTRSLKLLGVDLGSGFIVGNRTNPQGFWEHQEIVRIHQEILNRLGEPPFPAGWWRREEMMPFKQELKTLIESQFLNQQLWGWKDPRTSECMEMWKVILKEFNVVGKYIIMIRNPIDVAESFRKAYNGNKNRAISQWQKRTLLSLKGTEGEERIVVDYDRFLHDSFAGLHEIAHTFNLQWPQSPQNQSCLKKQLHAFIDPQLRHSRTEIRAFIHRKDITADVKYLYQLCMKAADSHCFLQSKPFQSEIERLYQSYIRAQM